MNLKYIMKRTIIMCLFAVGILAVLTHQTEVKKNSVIDQIESLKSNQNGFSDEKEKIVDNSDLLTQSPANGFKKTNNLIKKPAKSPESSLMSGAVSKTKSNNLSSQNLVLGLNDGVISNQNKNGSPLNSQGDTLSQKESQGNDKNSLRPSFTESMLKKLLDIRKPENIKELMLGINEELHFIKISDPFCVDKAYEMIQLLKKIILEEMRLINKKDWQLVILDNFVAQLKKTGSLLSLDDYYGKCIGQHFSREKLKIGVIKLIFFSKEIYQGPNRFYQMLKVPMITQAFNNNNFKETGRQFGSIINLVSESPVETIDDKKLKNVKIFSCLKSFGYNAMITANQSKGSDEKSLKSKFLQDIPRIIELTKNSCILKKDSKNDNQKKNDNNFGYMRNF